MFCFVVKPAPEQTATVVLLAPERHHYDVIYLLFIVSSLFAEWATRCQKLLPWPVAVFWILGSNPESEWSLL